MSTCLGGALPLLHNVLAPSHFGLESAINGGMAGWIIDFKVSSTIQPANQSMLPQGDHGALALAIKARLATQKSQ